MNKTIVIVLAVCFFALSLIAFITNPDETQHKNAFKDKALSVFSKYEADKNSEGNEYEKLGTNLGMILGESVIKRLVDQVITTKNYGLFSTTVIKNNSGEYTIGYGVFGKVYLNKEVDEKLMALFKNNSSE